MPTRKRGDRTGARTWLIAVLLTLVVHAGVVAGLWAAKPGTPRVVEPAAPEPIEFVFAPTPEPDQPRQFTELPPDRADKPPDHAELLSNVTSRARDVRAGASDGDLPRLKGDAEVPQLQMEPAAGRAAAPPADRPDPKASPDAPAAGPPASKPLPVSRSEPADSPVIRKPGGDTPLEAALEPTDAGKRSDPAPMSPAVADRLKLLSPIANLDYLQEAMRNPDGGALAAGGISLNTMAWAYAPWLERFGRDLYRQWTAPYAYYIGMIHGSQVLELQIARDGSLTRMNVLQVEGDSVLVDTSTLTFRALAPFEPLPPDFPEKDLILRIKLVYPQLVRAPRPAEPPPERRGRRRH